MTTYICYSVSTRHETSLLASQPIDDCKPICSISTSASVSGLNQSLLLSVVRFFFHFFKERYEAAPTAPLYAKSAIGLLQITVTPNDVAAISTTVYTLSIGDQNLTVKCDFTSSNHPEVERATSHKPYK